MSQYPKDIERLFTASGYDGDWETTAEKLAEEITSLRQRVAELEAENRTLSMQLGDTIAKQIKFEKDAERWRDKRSISNKITDVVAAQLHYFDEIENVHLSACKADEIAAILDAAIDRYRSDPKFYAKVTSMVAQLMQRLYETDAAIEEPI